MGVGEGAGAPLVSESLTKHSGVLLLHYLIYVGWGLLGPELVGSAYQLGLFYRTVGFLRFPTEIQTFAENGVESMIHKDSTV